MYVLKTIQKVVPVAIVGILLTSYCASAQTNFSKHYQYTTNSNQADIEIRVGDIDNLGFGWSEGFDPFCGKNTKKHKYPWDIDPKDPPGTDKIILGSGYKGKGRSDGYAARTKRPDNAPTPITIEYDKVNIPIKNVIIQLFADDFQAPVWGSSFQFSVDGKRLPYVEKVLNSLKQTGPIGKLVNLGILPEDIALFADGKVEILIDDPLTGAGDGFAIDFVNVLINPKGNYECTGTVYGVVLDEQRNPVQNVSVNTNALAETLSDAEGKFNFQDIPVGLISVNGNKSGYESANVVVELNKDDKKRVELILKQKKESGEFMKEQLDKKGSVDLYGIYFDTNKDAPKPESKATLEALTNLLNENPELSLTIVGHTDADGTESANQDLSNRRAKSIIKLLIAKGIDAARLKAEGKGEKAPVASNKTETGKALNRRVEIKKN
ncbi:OmpA family protein [Marixanthomonas spongiae]|uniref:OmpA-like domain-containing protein n=1 Tax=Marixanthomonas spongiae TaxID=2174845 RepID=A0A2U0I7Y0_9FLAO|nr:OmpA family protein [Marixanthomonas spongiae]PVW17212.1 hypothetical protein DDV96_01470 [Marixanthomonas spongiae]